MDWKKSKHILLITLIVLNVVLYRGVKQKMAMNTPSDEGMKVLLCQELERSGITLDTIVPEGEGELWPVDMRYGNSYPIQWNDRLFLGRGTVVRGEGGSFVVQYRDEKVTLSPDGSVRYERQHYGSVESLDTDKALCEIIPAFMERAGISMDDMVRETTIPDEEEQGFTVYFGKYYEGTPVEIAYTRVTVRGQEVVEMSRHWPEVVPVTHGTTTQTSSATKALFGLVGKESFRGKTITCIELCHYFTPTETTASLDRDLLQEGRARAAWRVRFRDGSMTILNPGDKIEVDE